MRVVARFLASGLIIVIAIGSGVFAAFDSTGAGSRFSTSIASGQWWTNPLVGSINADAGTRAYVARTGLLALAPEESTYYHLFDVDGQPISSDFVYELRGKDIPARWWSITLYGEDHFLVPNEENRYSVRSTQIKRYVDGRFVIYVSSEHREGNWIASGDGQNMSLSLRMYNPDPGVREKPDDLDLPVIYKVGVAP